MLKICIAFQLLLFAGYHAQSAAVGNDKNVVYFSDRLANLIKKHCLKYADETKATEALKGLQTFIYQWQIELPSKKLTAEAFYKNCMEQTEKFVTYLSKFVEKLTPCLAPEEDYLKSFILDSYGNYSTYLCKYMESLKISEQAKSSRDKCVTKFNENADVDDPLIACYKNSTVFGDQLNIDTVPKQKLCKDIRDIRFCNDEIFAKHCPDAKELEGLRRVLLTQSLINCLDVLENEAENV